MKRDSDRVLVNLALCTDFLPPRTGRTENLILPEQCEIKEFKAFCTRLLCAKKQLILGWARVRLVPISARGGSPMKRAVLYLRVSTVEQTTVNQERELREVASRMGCEIVGVYKDHGVSGAKGRDNRPAFDGLCRAATRREFDVVMAWSVDRLGRSLQDLIAFLSELHALGIDLFLYQQGLDTTTPGGKAMFQMMGVFAEFERAMITERVRAGLARANAEGKRLGRPRISEETERAIRGALGKKGRPGLRKIASALGVGVGTVQRIGRELG
jgi:DNA invertase Pin-like site-specific DNA recombinase